MTTERKGTGKERLSGEERRAQIIDVALTLFAEKGFSATRTKDLAQAAGVSEALIFQHFGSKDELIRDALAVLFHPHPITGELTASWTSMDDDTLFFRAIALHLIKHNREDPRIMKLALFTALEAGHFGELVRSRETGPDIISIISSFIQGRIDQGLFAAINPEITARLFIQTMFMYMADDYAAITGPRMPHSDEEVVETLVSLFLNGLKQR